MTLELTFPEMFLYQDFSKMSAFQNLLTQSMRTAYCALNLQKCIDSWTSLIFDTRDVQMEFIGAGGHNAPRCVAVCCRVLQWAAVCCSVLQRVAVDL